MASPMELVQTIPLDGVEGRMDHLAWDAAGQRLFLAALGNGTVEVMDLRAGKRLPAIPGLKEPQGILYLEASRQLVVAQGEGGACSVYDGSGLQLEATLTGLEDADNLRWDPAAQRIYVAYGGGALGRFAPDGKELLGKVALPAHPEGFQLERGGPRAFANVPGAHQVAVIDRERQAVVATWPLAEGKANFPMALDEADRRLFVGCRDPARLLVLDTASGKTVATADIAGDCDDVFYDAASKRIYASGGAGAITVLQQKDADHYELLASVATAPGARTCLLVPEEKRLFLAVPHRQEQRAELRVYRLAP